MPDAGQLAYLTEYLSDLGECSLSDSGMRVNSWVDMKAWADLSGLSLSYFEVSSLRRLSLAYVSQYHKSEDASCPSPCLEAIDRNVVEFKLKELFAMMRNSNG